MRVLAVGAHPDDIAILCGGTLARYAQDEHEVTICVASDGVAGPQRAAAEELTRVGRAEAEAAGRCLEARLIWLGLPAGLLFDDRPTRLAFVDAVRSTQPDVILTHAADDYHPDHRAVSRIVLAASIVSSLANVQTDHPAHQKAPHLYYMDTLAGRNFHPQEYVDIGEVMDTKRRMLACHAGQSEWLRDHDGLEITELMATMARARGLQAGVAFAEGFRAESSWRRGTPDRVLPGRGSTDRENTRRRCHEF